MRKTVEEHNKEVLDNFFYGLNDYRMLSLDEASELNKKYLALKHPNIKNHILRGVQHFIYDFINLSDINLGDQSVVDMEDVISYINVYLANGIEYGLFCDAKILFTNGIQRKIKTLDELKGLTSSEFMHDIKDYVLYNMNVDKLKGSKAVFNNLFLSDFYSYIANGKIFADPLTQVKETATCESFEDKDNADKLAFDLLRFLDDNDMLVTKDMYEEHFFGDRAVKTGKLRRQDFFLTNDLTNGELFRVIRSHPAFKEFRDRYNAL